MQNSQKNLEKKKKVEDLHFEITKLQNYGNWDSVELAKDRVELQSTEISPYIYGQLFFWQRFKDNQWEKINLFNKLCWNNQISTYERKKLDPYLTSYENLSQNRSYT